MTKILVVEDESLVAMDIQNALRSFHYEVPAVTGDGEEAVRKVEQERPDLVLMDIRLSGRIDGVDAAAQIQARFGVPVVFLSAYADEITLDRVKAGRPFGFILKPFERRDLRTAVEVALAKHSAERELREAGKTLEKEISERTKELALKNEDLRLEVDNHRLTEAALRQSEERFRTLVESAQEIISAVSPEGKIESLNPAFERLLGWPREEWIGREFGPLIHPDDLPAAIESFQSILKGEGSRWTELRIATKSGGHVTVESTTVPHFKDGRVAAVFTISRDVTQRKEMERSARESEERFRSIAQSAQDGIIVTDAQHRIKYANNGVRSLFGYFEDEIIGKDFSQLLRPQDWSSYHRALTGLLDQNEPRQKTRDVYEVNGIDRHNREFPLELSVSSWMTDGNRFFASILRDVSERKRVESHLKFQANILANVKDVVIVTDQQDRITYFNPGAEHLFARSLREVIGQPIDGIIKLNESKSADGATAEECLTSTGIWHGEILSNDVCLQTTISLLKSPEGAPAGRLLIARDVTEKKRLEKMLFHSEKLAAMGLMAAAVSHQLKSPLTVILGFVDMLSQRLKAIPSADTIMGPLESIRLQARRCVDLVANLLEFGRESPPLKTEVDLRDVILSAANLFEPYALTRSATVTKQLTSGLKVLGQKDMLEDIVINLAINALDAMAPGGELKIELCASRVKGRDGARIAVSDNGQGMSSNVQSKLFEPFFTTKPAGTGLGLWLVRELIDQMNGTIECQTESGKGTTFIVSFPVVSAPETVSPKPLEISTS